MLERNNYNLYTSLVPHDFEYVGTLVNVTKEEAGSWVYDCACDKFESYQGLHGVPNFDEICESAELDPDGIWDENDEMAFEDAYNNALEDHIGFYTEKESEDKEIDENERIILNDEI